MMTRKVKNSFLAILSLMLTACLSLFVAEGISMSVSADGEDSEKVTKIEYVVPEELMASDREIIFDMFLSKAWYGSLADSFTISYDVFSPNRLSGIGGVSINAKKGSDWVWLSNNLTSYSESESAETVLTDKNGAGVRFKDDMSAYITNGWYHREIELNNTGISEFSNLVVGIHKPKGVTWNKDDFVKEWNEEKGAYEYKIVVYYKNLICDLGYNSFTVYDFGTQSTLSTADMFKRGGSDENYWTEVVSMTWHTPQINATSGNFDGFVYEVVALDNVKSFDKSSLVLNANPGDIVDFKTVKDGSGAVFGDDADYKVYADGVLLENNVLEISGGENKQILLTYGEGKKKSSYAYEMVVGAAGIDRTTLPKTAVKGQTVDFTKVKNTIGEEIFGKEGFVVEIDGVAVENGLYVPATTGDKSVTVKYNESESVVSVTYTLNVENVKLRYSSIPTSVALNDTVDFSGVQDEFGNVIGNTLKVTVDGKTLDGTVYKADVLGEKDVVIAYGDNGDETTYSYKLIVGEENVLKIEYTVAEELMSSEKTVMFEARINTTWFGYASNNIVLKYDVYSPNALSGIGGLGFSGRLGSSGDWPWLTNNFDSFENAKKATGDALIKDGNGVGVRLFDDMSAYITNGWYGREIDTSAYGKNISEFSNVMVGIYKPAGVTWNKENFTKVWNESIGAYEYKIFVYYRNIRYNLGGEDKMMWSGRENIEVDTKTMFTCEHDQNSYWTKKTSTGEWMTPEVIDKKGNALDFFRIEKGAVTVRSIDASTLPKVALTENVCDFASLKDGAGNAIGNVAKVYADGELLEDNKFTPTETGTKKITVVYGEGSNQTVYSYNLTVNPGNTFTFTEDDFSKIARKGNSGSEIFLPTVYSWLNAKRDMAGVVTVENLTVPSEEVKLYDAEGGKAFRPAGGGDYVYRVTYMASRDGFTPAEYTFEIESFWTMNTDVLDVPQTDGKYRIDIFGTEVELPKNAENMAINFDGSSISSVLTKVTDPFGNEIFLTDKGDKVAFRANISTDNKLGGVYTLHYSVTGEYGEKTVEIPLCVGHDRGMVLHVKVKNPGQKAIIPITVYGWMDNIHNLLNGDKLSYEMYVPSGVNGAMVDFQYNNTWNNMNTNRNADGVGYRDLLDQNGIKLNVTPEAAKTGWVLRQFVLNGELVSDKGSSSNLIHFFVRFEYDGTCDDEYIDLYFRNVKFIAASGIETIVYDGYHGLNPSRQDGGNEEWSAYSQTDLFPQIDKTLLKERYGTKDAVVIPQNAVLDFYRNAYAEGFTVEVKDGAGNAVVLENGRFMATSVGTYTLTYSKDGYSVSYEFLVVDDTAPTAELKDKMPETVEVGATVALPSFILSDNITASDKISVSYIVNYIDAQGNKTKIKVENDSFVADKEGVYTINVVIKDTAGNRTNLDYTVTAKSKTAGCSCFMGEVAGLSILLAVAVVVVITVRKKKSV